jgi:hypothetical protein
MTGAEARGNAQPDFAALNPGLAGRRCCSSNSKPIAIPAKIIQFVTPDTIKSCRSAHQGEGDRNDGVANESGAGLKQPQRACFFG